MINREATKPGTSWCVTAIIADTAPYAKCFKDVQGAVQ